MNDWQLDVAVGIPSVLILVNMVQNNKRFDDLKDGMNARFGEVNLRFSEVIKRLDSIEADLRVFYRDLGRHDEAIEALKKK